MENPRDHENQRQSQQIQRFMSKITIYQNVFISVNSMKITTTIPIWGSAQSAAHSRSFMSAELILTTPVCTKEQSMEVNEDDMQFNVRHIALPSVSHYPSQPQSMIHWIPIYCTWGETPMEDTSHLWDTCSSIAAGVTTHTYTDTHSIPPSDCKMKLQELQYWHVMTSTGRQMRGTHTRQSVYLLTGVQQWGGKYLQYSPKVTGKSGAEDGGEWIRKSDWMR